MKNKRFNIASIKNPYVRRGTTILVYPLFFVVLGLVAVGVILWSVLVAVKDVIVKYGGGFIGVCTRNVYIAWIGQDKWNNMP
jgi:hypothetical protein